MTGNKPRHFVLVHGLWHGGWCWERVAAILEARGHRVTTPTNTGLGQRSHLLSRDITVSTFVEDIVNVLIWSELRDVILVGHSFGGVAVTGAADQAPDRIAKLIYLDGAIFENGESMFGLLPADLLAERQKLLRESSNGLSLPVPSLDKLGITVPEQAAFLAGRLTPHPAGTLTSPLILKNPVGNNLPVDYVICTAPLYQPAEVAHGRARAKGWPIHELKTGHDAMVTAPAETADLLERLSK
jgi:pimeloyl-ACP methyl ester carboxylesterase